MHLKGFATAAFLSAFDRLQRAGESTPGQRKWEAFGLAWSRDRLSSYSADFSVTLNIVRASAPPPANWTLMVVREGWWADEGVDPFRTPHWAHLASGDRKRALADIERLCAKLQS